MKMEVGFSESEQGFEVNMGQTQSVAPGGSGDLPPGGKAGQYLRKRSNADGDVEWADLKIPEEYGLITYDQNKTITVT